MKGSLSVLDRALYALFSQQSDRPRHDADRKRYRGTTVTASFDVYLARVYGLSWLAFLGTAIAASGVVLLLPDATLAEAGRLVGRLTIPLPAPFPRRETAIAVAILCGAIAKETTIRTGGRYLAWAARARRTDIDRTLPGAVRYLHVLASGTTDERDLLRRVAAMDDAYGETAITFRKVVNVAELTGSLDFAIRQVARDTPSRDALAPFLLKLREHAQQGPDAMAGYLQLESRMLGHRQSRQRQQAEGFLELVAELFIVLLVLPALFVIVVSVLSVLAPGLGEPVPTPFGETTFRAILVYGSGGFVLLVGLLASSLVGTLRPPGYRWTGHTLADDPIGVLVDVGRNPANAAVVFGVVALVFAGVLQRAGVDPVNVVLLSYTSFALPVGTISVRRARLDDAKDREIKDFVHAVSGHVSLGQPFGAAVEHVARDVDLGALDDDVADLAFTLGLTTHEGEQRASALHRFVDQVGTPLAGQTIGLVTGALDAGSDAETAFEALQAEVGRLYHQKRALRSQLLVYVAVGWTTAILVVGIMVAVNVSVLDSFAQLAAVSSGNAGLTLDPTAVDLERDRYRFYVVTQSTMLACGWFAGAASRGRYEALLHSGALVAIAYVVFAGAGLL